MLDELIIRTNHHFGTIDPKNLSKIIDIQVVYGRWHPVTFGELDLKNGLININLNAPVPPEEILIHELGHYLIHFFGILLDRKQEEKLVDEWVNFLKNC